MVQRRFLEHPTAVVRPQASDGKEPHGTFVGDFATGDVIFGVWEDNSL